MYKCRLMISLRRKRDERIWKENSMLVAAVEFGSL